MMPVAPGRSNRYRGTPKYPISLKMPISALPSTWDPPGTRGGFKVGPGMGMTWPPGWGPRGPNLPHPSALHFPPCMLIFSLGESLSIRSSVSVISNVITVYKDLAVEPILGLSRNWPNNITDST